MTPGCGCHGPSGRAGRPLLADALGALHVPAEPGYPPAYDLAVAWLGLGLECLAEVAC